jgi:hypothetical protein
VHKVDALPGEMMERVETRFLGAPVELIDPIGDQLLQPFQIGALLPADTGDLVRPSRAAQAGAEVVEGFVRDVNVKAFHRWLSVEDCNNRLSPSADLSLPACLAFGFQPRCDFRALTAEDAESALAEMRSA